MADKSTYSIRVDHKDGYGWFHYRGVAPPKADDIVRVRAMPRTDMVGPPPVIDVRITRSEDGEPIAAVELGSE